ncbi:MAG: alpha/beta fold hydrolase [Acidimicrobiia bacterium]|nr:alpha/beta fold hydrolase [Acidimicrobiia bacterium]
MRTEKVEFYSDGVVLRGMFRSPDQPSEQPGPALVHGPGWLGLASGQNYANWHEGLTAAGYSVLVFDYRGFGDSDGDTGWVRPDWQLEDLLNAVAYLTTRQDVDSDRIGSYGMGGTGGGNAVLLACHDERIKAVAAQSVVADGRDWLHRMRREYEWVAYLEQLEEDRQRWVLEGKGEIVHPREGLMVETPERRAIAPKKDVDARMPNEFFLRSAEYIMRYRPIDVVHRISPRALLITSVENDVVTPEDHAVALFERAGGPKKLVRQRDTSHYRAYKENFGLLLAEIIDWYDEHLKYASVRSTEVGTAEAMTWIDNAGVGRR